jgi:signal transduction histidine kinase
VEIDPLPVLHASEPQLSTVLRNLIGNGLKFRNGRPATVKVSAFRREGAWCLAVSDNGIGVPSADADRIFDLFERLDPSHYPGSGIGLAACRRIVESHGGRIWTEPAPDGGSLFAFTLPD